jgi:hypothetical protein
METGMVDAHRVEGEGRIELKGFDPSANAGAKRETGEVKQARPLEELGGLPLLLYAARHRSVAVVSQGRGARGKKAVEQCLRSRREA